MAESTSALASAIAVLLNRMHTAVTIEMKVDLLERLVWLLDDNGSELERIRRDWIRGGDPEFMDLALTPWRAPIASSVEEAEELLAALRSNPQYEGRVEDRVAECERHD